MVFVLDNYDSFTYNLVQYFEEMGAEVHVARNDGFSPEEIAARRPSGIVISPGPGRPEDAGQTLPVIRRFAGEIPILGVCLGHQAIAVAYGGRVIPARRLMHGKTSQVTADGKSLFQGIREPFAAMRYHSLAVEASGLPECLEVSARAEDGEIMGLRHRTLPVEGLQFHPESIMTSVGKRLLRNFLNGLET
jgi:anthranilate synthase/aminodeoxychorismate synthase-like glutamine amidotransferase